MKKFDNVRNVFKTVKHRGPTKIYCPRCASPNISLHSSLDFWLTPQLYLCKDCGYLGAVVMELEKEKETENPT
ncbi:MAG: hypothetical protein ACE14S_09520 [Candidatus Bathyarchaeia archaeon]